MVIYSDLQWYKYIDQINQASFCFGLKFDNDNSNEWLQFYEQKFYELDYFTKF